jgi:hypothetical protein
MVVPVEAAATLGGRDQQRQENGAEERLLLRRLRAGVRAGEDAGSRLAQELLERDPGVFPGCELARARLDEGPHERPVLVQRRPAPLHVLLECEREVVALFERPTEEDERAQAEGAQREVEVRCAYRHPSCLLPRRPASCLAARAPVSGAVRVALTA